MSTTVNQFLSLGEAKGATPEPSATMPSGEKQSGAKQYTPHRDAMDRRDEYVEHWEHLPKTTFTGFENIDTSIKLRGFTTIGAGSGVGKTTFALNVVLSRLIKKRPCIVITLEMSAAEILERLACIAYRKTIDELTAKDIRGLYDGIKIDDPDGINAADDDKRIKLNLDYLTIIEYDDTENKSGGFDADWLAADVESIRQRIRANDPKANADDVFIVVDSLNLLNADGNDERRAVNQIVRSVNRFVRTNGVTVLMIAQFGKETLTTGRIKNANPTTTTDFAALMYEFKESSLIPYLSDVCLLLLNDPNNVPENSTATVWVCDAKNRKNSANNAVPLTFYKPYFTMDEQN